MKIHQLPMGARFEFGGQEYLKTGPMLATGPGGQRLIPRYAVLTVLGEPPAGGGPGKGGAIARETVTAAFAIFQAECRPLVPDPTEPAWRAACERFLRSLG